MYPQKEFDEDAEDRMINEKIRVRGSCQSTSPNSALTDLLYGRSCDSLRSFMLRHDMPRALSYLIHIVIFNVLNLNYF